MNKENIKLIAIALAVLLVIAIIFVTLMIYVVTPISKHNQEIRLEQEIIKLADEQIDIKGDCYQLELISVEKVGWAKYECYNYVLTTTTHKYHIGAMRNEKEIHFVDVISEEELEKS